MVVFRLQLMNPKLIVFNEVCTEQLFIDIYFGQKQKGLIGGTYIPPDAYVLVYESHTSSIEKIWNALRHNLVCCYFNVPKIVWGRTKFNQLKYCS